MTRRPPPAGEEPALFRRWPELKAKVPWLPIGRWPTPVEPLPELGRALGAEVWVKRDDLSASPYGGNKPRKLEFLLGYARRRGARRILTAGGFGSHHALATTLYARGLGWPVSLLLFPQPPTPHARTVLRLLAALGAALYDVPRMELVPAGLLVFRIWGPSEGLVVVPPGGSSPLGTFGYVSAGLELAEQVAAGQAPRPDAVHIPAGTLGTVAGLALGFALAGLSTRIVATRITSRLVANMRALGELVRVTAGELESAGAPATAGLAAAAERALTLVELRHDQIGRGYGHPTRAGEAAADLFAMAAGLRLDPTYTAKTAAQLAAAARERPGQVLLFWHTLGDLDAVPVRPADPETLPSPFRRWLERGATAR